jgi:hypothetical protein
LNLFFDVVETERRIGVAAIVDDVYCPRQWPRSVRKRMQKRMQ